MCAYAYELDATRHGLHRRVVLEFIGRVAEVDQLDPARRGSGQLGFLAVTFVPMPVPKTVSVTTQLFRKWVQNEMCKTCWGRGMGMNVTAQLWCTADFN